MARLHTNILHWGNKYDGPNNYKDGRRGALDDAFWDDDELVDYRREGGKKGRKRLPGCPDNEGKSHVYVWVDVRYYSWYRDTYTVYEEKVCCGCLKQATGRHRFRRKKTKTELAGKPRNI